MQPASRSIANIAAANGALAAVDTGGGAIGFKPQHTDNTPASPDTIFAQGEDL
ncbi:hypothetical protein GCM10010909_17090 [Acidocella aquatica]|uniref:Uncharacterized protein n=1 Tax=Acidocella aquatica TaxID=1922313 RepID=A0ABQ6A5U6_9PROT|nr:hypothetical protein [Acidocella aquatica]GLR67028.1 hypothetical protein GCM10010909_17090 [Acidocella aquatica]